MSLSLSSGKAYGNSHRQQLSQNLPIIVLYPQRNWEPHHWNCLLGKRSPAKLRCPLIKSRIKRRRIEKLLFFFLRISSFAKEQLRNASVVVVAARRTKDHNHQNKSTISHEPQWQKTSWIIDSRKNAKTKWYPTKNNNKPRAWKALLLLLSQRHQRGFKTNLNGAQTTLCEVQLVSWRQICQISEAFLEVDFWSKKNDISRQIENLKDLSA